MNLGGRLGRNRYLEHLTRDGEHVRRIPRNLTVDGPQLRAEPGFDVARHQIRHVVRFRRRDAHLCRRHVKLGVHRLVYHIYGADDVHAVSRSAVSENAVFGDLRRDRHLIEGASVEGGNGASEPREILIVVQQTVSVKGRHGPSLCKDEPRLVRMVLRTDLLSIVNHRNARQREEQRGGHLRLLERVPRKEALRVVVLHEAKDLRIRMVPLPLVRKRPAEQRSAGSLVGGIEDRVVRSLRVRGLPRPVRNPAELRVPVVGGVEPLLEIHRARGRSLAQQKDLRLDPLQV